MVLKKFFVKGLFGTFDNQIDFDENGITIIAGQNGCGKTTMLRMLAAVFSKNHSQLFQFKFDYIELFIHNHVLKIEPIPEKLDEGMGSVKSLQYSIDAQIQENRHNENSKINSPVFWTRTIPYLKRRSNDTFIDLRRGEVLTLSEVIDAYFDELPEDVKNDIIGIPSRLPNDCISPFLRSVVFCLVVAQPRSHAFDCAQSKAYAFGRKRNVREHGTFLFRPKVRGFRRTRIAPSESARLPQAVPPPACGW